jgi:hypothetical protein
MPRNRGVPAAGPPTVVNAGTTAEVTASVGPAEKSSAGGLEQLDHVSGRVLQQDL